MRRGFVVLVVVVFAALVAAELWLRARGFARPPAVATAAPPEPPTVDSPERPRAAPLLIVGGSFTAADGMADDERWPRRLATKVVDSTGFSEVVVGAPLADPGPFLRATLEQLARTQEPPSTRGLNVVQHARGADVVVVEAGGDALGADPTPFLVEDPPSGAAARAAPAGADEGHALALWNWLDQWRAARALAGEEQAVARLVATDGFVAGAAARSRKRLEALTAAVSNRRPNAGQTRFLRALINELHGLHRIEVRLHALADWRRLFSSLRMEQRSTLLVISGPSLTTVALVQLAQELAIPIVHAPPFDLDPRLCIAAAGGRAAAAVHAEVADAVWAALTRRGILPQPLHAPAEFAERAEQIEAAARARGGVDEALIALAHTWLAERCDFGAVAPPEALFGVGASGRLVPGEPAEVVLKQPPLPVELIVTASVKVGTGALPRLKLRHARGEVVLEPRPLNAVPAKEAGRAVVEYRVAAPPTKDVVVWPAYELTVAIEPGAVDPRFELASLEITRASAPPDQDPPAPPPSDRNK